MRSSTFSSERAALEWGWGRTWALAAVVVVAIVGLLEIKMRAFGIRPSVEDNASLWGYWRGRIAEEGSGLTIIVGSSRAQLGIDLESLREGVEGQGTCVQLALDGSGSLAVLEDLSTSPVARSLVLCELHPALTFGAGERAEDRPRERLNAQSRREAWRDAEVALESSARMRLTSLRPKISPLGLSRLVHSSSWGRFLPLATLPTRQRIADYATVDCLEQDRHWVGRTTEMNESSALVDIDRLVVTLNRCVRRLEERGTRVVFLRMPSNGLTKEAEDLFWPRAKTWDRLAAAVEAPFIHFEDEPELRSHKCAEGSHLDAATAREFTKGLIEVLRRRDLLSGG